MSVWIVITLWSVLALAGTGAVTYVLLAGLPISETKKAACIALSGVLMGGVLTEVILATITLADPQTTLRLKDGKVIAQIYREAYSLEINGTVHERPEGWYLRIGDTPPQKPATDVGNFPVLDTTAGEKADIKAKAIHHAGSPGATIRASIADLGDAPLQICTGACEGISSIPDDQMVGTPGIVIADWARVQEAKLGQPALGTEPKVDATLPDFPIGHWLLSTGIGLALAAINTAFWRRQHARQAKRVAAPKS